MASAVLIVASTRMHADAQEILRVQDAASALVDQGRAVDLLVPRRSSLLTATLDRNVRLFQVPRIPRSANPPDRPSFRRTLAGLLMLLRGVSLAARNDYAVVHGFNDGAFIARAIARAAASPRPYVAEMLSPFSSRRFFKSPQRAIACAMERKTIARAAATIFRDEETLALFGRGIPLARVSIIPDPHTDFVPGEFTRGDFIYALEQVYSYVLRPRS